MLRRYPIYVVDDQEAVRKLLCAFCAEKRGATQAFANGEALLSQLDQLPPGCLLLDMRMPGMNGLDVQAEIAARDAPLAVVAMSGNGFVDLAVESMKMGAVDFLEKPFQPDALFAAIGLAFQTLDARLERPSPLHS